MMESMSLLALELNEARQREIALATMRAAHGVSGIEEQPTDERAWPSPAPQLVLVESEDCEEQLAA
jgi:hypothetical protein